MPDYDSYMLFQTLHSLTLDWGNSLHCLQGSLGIVVALEQNLERLMLTYTGKVQSHKNNKPIQSSHTANSKPLVSRLLF